MSKRNCTSILNISLSFPVISILGILLGTTANHVQAATLSPDNSPEGISYEFTVTMNESDTAQLRNYVGAKSWNEPNHPIGLKGWTHTSNWIALELTEAVKLTVKVESFAGVVNPLTGISGDQLDPAFSLYSGWQISGLEDHQYNTLGNTEWADELTYLAHKANGSGASQVMKTFILSSGQYSIAIGGDPSDPLASGLQGYQATLTTAPVPEPLSILGVFTAIGFGGIFKRRFVNK